MRGGRGRSGGAAHLARIHGTEEDKVNCPFYFKIGACRHADRCSRLHHRPAFSPTILIKHIYRHPDREAELRAAAEKTKGSGDSKKAETSGQSSSVDAKATQEEFLQFFENMFEELGKFGRLDALHVCDNLGDHMIGHVYAKFSDEEEAADALQIMNGRYYDGRKMLVEYSPVTDFREARCRDFDEDTCSRGGFCNFMHIKPVPECLIMSLEEDCEMERRREAMKRAEREHRDKSRKRRRGRRSRDSGTDSSSDSDSDYNAPGNRNSRSRSRSREGRDRRRTRDRDVSSRKNRTPSSSRSISPTRRRTSDKNSREKNNPSPE